MAMKNWFILLLLLSNLSLLLGHSGGQDSKGGHHDRINGGYHYHHGHGPHQHPGGKCELLNNENPRLKTNNIDQPKSSKGLNLNVWVVGILGVGAGYLINNVRKK